MQIIKWALYCIVNYSKDIYMCLFKLGSVQDHTPFQTKV